MQRNFLFANLKSLWKSNGLNVCDAIVHRRKDDVAGEVPVAFVVRATSSTITEDEVKDYIAKQVVFYKKIHNVYFVDSVPKSPSGKILRKDLRNKV